MLLYLAPRRNLSDSLAVLEAIQAAIPKHPCLTDHSACGAKVASPLVLDAAAPLLFQEGRALTIDAVGSIDSAAVGLAKRRSDMVFAEIRSDSPDSFDYDSRNTELSGDSTDCVARASIFCLLPSRIERT